LKLKKILINLKSVILQETHIKKNKLMTCITIKIQILLQKCLQTAINLKIRNKVKLGIGKKINLHNFDRVIKLAITKRVRIIPDKKKSFSLTQSDYLSAYNSISRKMNSRSVSSKLRMKIRNKKRIKMLELSSKIQNIARTWWSNKRVRNLTVSLVVIILK
jgi:hypothetical protein